jgi:hypothetical protein
LQRVAVTGFTLGAFAVLTTSSALGYVAEATPQVSGAIMLTLLLLLLPFGLGAMVGRRWIVLFVFVTVLATVLLPDRTVVHLSRDGINATRYDTPLPAMLLFALVAATAAWAGLLTRRPVGPDVLQSVWALMDSVAVQALMLIASGLLLGWVGVVALAIALLVRAANRR